MKYNQIQKSRFLGKLGEKALFSTLFILLATSFLFAAQEYIVKVTLDDGSVKEYAINYITKITFEANPNDNTENLRENAQDLAELEHDQDSVAAYQASVKRIAPNTEVATAKESQNSLKIIPTKESILVSSLTETPARVFIFNAQGMCLKTFETNLHPGLNQFEIDKNSFKNNQYILRIKTPKNEQSTRFSLVD